MAQVELIMPKMGESIMEATILKWVKKVGDSVEEDETILEIATDKVDSEVPSPTEGVITKIFFQEDETIQIGKVIAIISTDGDDQQVDVPTTTTEHIGSAVNGNGHTTHQTVVAPVASLTETSEVNRGDGRFYSPLVRNMAQKENIGQPELDRITGSGLNGRVTKKDMLAYIKNRTQQVTAPTPKVVAPPTVQTPVAATPSPSISGNVEIVEMDRMRRLIADHMVMSKQTSPHVTSFVEIDVTNLVNWRNKVKKDFQAKYGQKITFTPIFIEAVVKAIGDFPMVNVSVQGKQIIVKKDINIGMAAALPSGNLIVPVIKNADEKNLLGITKSVNDLANRARGNKLKPDEIQGGTFTVTNVGTFGNTMGTPIINQPQVAILATGAIKKKPAVIETEYGDVIAVRQMMFLSLSYDHRVVDGFLGGSFLRKVGDYLEDFDVTRTI